MQRIHKIKSAIKIVSILLLITKSIYAHKKEDISNLTDVVFKQRIDNLCSGHGLVHLKYLEIQKIANLFTENLKDVSSLQQNAKNDKYLTNLTFLIIRSNLPESKKQDLLRKSYQISLTKSQEGEEWMLTIGILIKQTKVLSIEEITSHTQSTNEYLKYISKKYLQDLKHEKPKIEIDKPKSIKSPNEKPSRNPTTGVKLKKDYRSIPQKEFLKDKDGNLPKESKITRPDKNRTNDNVPKNYTLYITVGILFIGAILVSLISWKKTQS